MRSTTDGTDGFSIDDFIRRDIELGFQIAERAAIFSGKLVAGSHPRRREPCAEGCAKSGRVLAFKVDTP